MAGGIPYDKLRQRRYSGTTSATANDPAKIKKVLPPEWAGCTRVAGILDGEGVYIEGGNFGTGRAGINCPVAPIVVDAAGNAVYDRLINLSSNVWVAVYADAGDSNKGKATVITKVGTVLSAGTPVVFNNAVTIGIDAKRISDTQFVISYIDDGGDDYLGAIVGTVAGSVITFGDEALLVSAAITKASGTGLAISRPGVLSVNYILAGDSKHYIVAATFAAAVIGTPGTPVGVTATLDTVLNQEAIAVGRVVVAYAIVSTGYLTTRVCTVSAAGVCVVGSATAAHNGAATTAICIRKASENRGVLSWIDGGDNHALAFDIGATGTTLHEGADATLAGTHLHSNMALFDSGSGVIAYEDDAHGGKYGMFQRFTITWAAIGSGGAVAFDTTLDVFAELTPTYGRVAANDRGELVVIYVNAADSNAIAAVYGVKTDGILDIRSTVASATYYLDAFPVYEYEKVY